MRTTTETTTMTTTEPPPSASTRPLRSARARLLLTIFGLLVASTLLSTFLLREILSSRVADRVQNNLVQEIDEFRTLAREGIDPESGEPFSTDVSRVFDVYLQRNVPNQGEEWFTFVGTQPYRSTTEPEADPDIVERIAALGSVTRTQRGEIELGSRRIGYIAVPLTVDGERRGAFVTTADLAREQDEVDQATQVAAGVALAVLLAALIAAFLVVGRILAPLRDLTDTARAITESDLTRRIDVRGDDEIAELGRTFNAMLDRIDAAFGVQRDFVSDAGHELRTPITIIRGHLELLGEDPVERDETLALVGDELNRMSRIVEDLLVLAKAEQSNFLQHDEIDLDLFSEELLAKAEALGSRTWVLEALGTGRITADRQRLTQAVMNLAHNAVQHTSDGDRIALGSTLTPTEARIWVTDTGPGIPAADRERIFERFTRGAGRRRSDGAGLGLAIVRAIVEAHGGELTLSTREGHGSTFTVRIPTDPPDPPHEEDLP